MDQIVELRKQVDKIDNDIISLIAKRMDIVKKIGAYKKQNNIPLLDSKRWEEVIKSKINLGNTLGIPQVLIEKIYNTIHKFALKIEKSL
ncbi:MAG: chorismate mutase [bacterium]|nr:chorismate mutase [bacterium]